MSQSEKLKGLGFAPGANVFHNLPRAELYERAIRNGEAKLSHAGALVAETGKHTGRSAKDKYTVRDETTADVIWWGDVNQPIEPEVFGTLRTLVFDHLQQRDLYIFDGYAGADPAERMKVRVVNTYAWHNLFAWNMFVRPREAAEWENFEPEFTVYHAPDLQADAEALGLRSGTFVVISFRDRVALIGGTHYAGEIKKTIFSVMNKRLPETGILSMHCSANYGVSRDDVALFFGLSGTGKTTLSADSERVLIGDDEHGWGSNGVFNIEGGCYAKVINLSRQNEPEIWDASQKFGTILENVVLNERREPDFENVSLTENTRSSYPITNLPEGRVDLSGIAGHPKHIVFLTADAFGVLPPIARLTTPQAMYHFMSGYTAKVAGTEIGVTEPQATFSACFGAPFLPLHPARYAELLAKKIEQHKPAIWLVNTGWSGGPYGVGSRMKLAWTRQMVRSALKGQLEKVAYTTDPVFGLSVPTEVPDVPNDILLPRNTWSDPAAYDAQAAKLAAMFAENFRQFADEVSEEVRNAGPKIAGA